jgi:hypothetical protein
VFFDEEASVFRGFFFALPVGNLLVFARDIEKIRMPTSIAYLVFRNSEYYNI